MPASTPLPLPDGVRPGGRFAEWRPRPPRYVVADVDGTLLASGTTPTPAVAAAVRDAVAAGLHVGVATGRPPNGVRALLDVVGADGPHVVHDGAEVRHRGRALRTWPLSRDELTALLRVCAADGRYAELWAASDGGERLLVTARPAQAAVHWDLVTGPPDGDAAELDHGHADVVKATVVVFDPEPAEPVLRRLAVTGLRVGHSTSPVMPGLTFLNLTTPAADKGVALRAGAEAVGCALEEVVAVGDGRNDLPLFAAAGTAVAMGQAAAEVRDAAHLVVPTVADDGLASALAAVVAWRAPAQGIDGMNLGTLRTPRG